MTTKFTPIRAYHGSGTSIDRFDYKFTDQGDDQHGSGFYFTSDFTEASSYCIATVNGLPKLGGSDSPTIHVVDLDIRNPLAAEHEEHLSPSQVKSIIMKSPILDECLDNFGDVSFEGRTKVMNRACDAYAQWGGSLLQRFHALANDFFSGHVEQFNRAVHAATGYDGVVKQWDGKIHYVAWFPEQVHILQRIPHGAPADDIEVPPAAAKPRRKMT